MRAKSLLVGLLIVSLLSTAALPGLALAQSTGTDNATDARTPNLIVDQPAFVDSDIRQDGDTYTASYAELTIVPRSFEHRDVVEYGLDTDAGSLTYDSTYDTYEFDAGEDEGTFELYWIVEEERQTNGTSTTEQVRYESTIQVEDAQQYEHHPAGTLEQQRSDAENWSAVTSDVRQVSGDDADVDQQLDVALALLEFRNNPFSALTGNFTALLTALAISPGGWFVLLLFGILFVISTYSIIARRNWLESVLGDEAELQEEMSQFELEKKKQALENMDWQDVPGFDDTTARAFRESMGLNPLEGTKRLLSTLRPAALIHDRLLAMGQSGYVAVVERDTARTDGGADTDEPAPITSVDLRQAHEIDTESVDGDIDDLEDPSDELVDALDWNDDTLRSFDLPDATLDPDAMSTELSALDFEELMAEMDASRQDFDDEGVYGQYIREFVESVRDHNITDEDGRIDETRYAMNQLLHLANVERDLFDIPIMEFVGDAVERTLIDHDPIADAKSFVDDVEAGKFS
jgi:type II secretory pathway pseudopilin PulG